jgi:hypothetical protein
MEWKGYSLASQTISELSAIGAPTKALWLPLIIIYEVLHIAFGCGVLLAEDKNRYLNTAGILIIVHGIISLFCPPMHLRGVEPTLTDTMHVIFGTAIVVIMMLTMGFGAASFGKRFRFYSIVSIVIFLVFGILMGLDGPKIAANLPTPLIGIWERISVFIYMLWIIVLAIVLLYSEKRYIRYLF